MFYSSVQVHQSLKYFLWKDTEFCAPRCNFPNSIVVIFDNFCTRMSSINSNNLERIFHQLDRNGDGIVSLDELEWLLGKLGIHHGPDELESLVGKTSLDLIDFSFFYDSVVKSNDNDGNKIGEKVNNLEDSDLVDTFKVYDLNGDGFISCEELRSVLAKLGLVGENCDGDCESMIRVYDANSDGVLDFEEFKNMMVISPQA